MGYEIFEGIRADHYDKNIRILFPQYEFLLSLLGVIFGKNTGLVKNPNLLIVGSGTGAEIEHVHKHLPYVHMTGVDISPEMVKIAESKLIKSVPGSSYELITGSVYDLPKEKYYDGATLLLVLHFLPDDGSKLSLLKEISSRLNSSALLVLSDIFDYDGLFNYNLDLLKAYLISQRKDKEVVHQLMEHFKNDIHYISETRTFDLLMEAGFINVKKILQSTIYGTWLCEKA